MTPIGVGAFLLFAVCGCQCGWRYEKPEGWRHDRPEGWRYEKPGEGLLHPASPQWVLEGTESDPLPGAENSVFVVTLDENDERNLRLYGYCIGEQFISHQMYCYRFFPRGRVLFSPLPVSNEEAARLAAQGPRNALSIDFDENFRGRVGRYQIRDGQIRIELFTKGHAPVSFFGVDCHYRMDEGPLTDSGFVIERSSTRHKLSWNDRVFQVAREAVRWPVSVPMRREATW